MKFNVKTFLLTEGTDNGTNYDITEEMIENVDTLKNAGFETLVETIQNNSEDGENDKIIVPFKQLTKTEYKILKLCFSHMCSPSDFKHAVPLEVASLMALSTEKSYFKKIKIHCDNQTQNSLLSEFIVTGCTVNSYNGVESNTYILGHWSIHDLSELTQLRASALHKALGIYSEKIKESISDLNKYLTNSDKQIERWLDDDIYIGQSII